MQKNKSWIKGRNDKFSCIEFYLMFLIRIGFYLFGMNYNF